MHRCSGGISIVSGYFIIIFPQKIYCFADSGVVPEPDAVQLADITLAAAENFPARYGRDAARRDAVVFVERERGASQRHESPRGDRAGAATESLAGG